MKKTFRLEGLDCANCAAKIERGVAAIDGVTNCQVNFMTTKMTVEFDDGMAERIQSEAEKVVHKYEPGVVVKKA